MNKRPRKRKPLTSPLNIQLEIYRNRWLLQQQIESLFPASPFPDDLTEAEISSVRACLEAMIRHYEVPIRSVAFYLQESPETIQDWKHGRILPTRTGIRMLQALVKELDQARRETEGPPPPRNPNRIRHVPESFKSLRRSGRV